MLRLVGNSQLFPHEHTMADQRVFASFGSDEVQGVIVEKPHLKAGLVAVLNQMNSAILCNYSQQRFCRFVRVLTAIMTLQVLTKYLPGMRALEESTILLREFEAVILVCVSIRNHEIGLARPNPNNVRIRRPSGLLLGSHPGDGDSKRKGQAKENRDLFHYSDLNTVAPKPKVTMTLTVPFCSSMVEYGKLGISGRLLGQHRRRFPA
ncbi:MAG: hypothetical protein C0629_16875 [Chromatiales bacterium]|nr:MAG: hypothetical protein C0629_16875 [Chromatiales bacterium]